MVMECFGITVTWWDNLFGSVLENPEKIPPRIIDFFFASVEENKNANRGRSSVLLQFRDSYPMRCFIASYRIMPAATDTFNDSKSFCIGILK